MRFDKETQINFLKRKYTPTSHYYSWHTLTHRPGEYYACGKRVVQEILRSAQAESISVEEYVYEYNQFYATTDVYRTNWFRYLENRKKRHITNVALRRNARSKDARKKIREESRKFRFITIDEFLKSQKQHEEK